MSIPRGYVCWYCERGQHAKCGLPQTCNCYACYPAETREGCIFGGRCVHEGDDALSRQASLFRPS